MFGPSLRAPLNATTLLNERDNASNSIPSAVSACSPRFWRIAPFAPSTIVNRPLQSPAAIMPTCFSTIVRATTDADAQLLQYVVTIKAIVKEGIELLALEALKRSKKDSEKGSKKRSWEPYPKSALHKQLREAQNPNASKDSLWRNLFIYGGYTTKAVTIIGLVNNNRNCGNRTPKKTKLPHVGVGEANKDPIDDENRTSKKSKLSHGGVGEADKDPIDDEIENRPHRKPTLEETLKSWPVDVLMALINVVQDIVLPDRISLWIESQDTDTVYKGKRKSGLWRMSSSAQKPLT